jgi:hypothetical protein
MIFIVVGKWLSVVVSSEMKFLCAALLKMGTSFPGVLAPHDHCYEALSLNHLRAFWKFLIFKGIKFDFIGIITYFYIFQYNFDIFA